MKLNFIIIYFIYIIGNSVTFTLTPYTVGGIASGAGKLSNTIKKTTAWKTFTSHQNSIRSFLAPRAMQVVREVVGTFRNEKRVVVQTPYGRLRGRLQAFKTSVPGFYYSFRGIRYGQPPVGSRRFRSALPEQPWKGIRNALSEGNACPHKNLLLETFKGSEDCLFLNVYTKHLPDINGHPRLPVMVWIHGGGFTFGSGNSFLYGPDFIVAENVVLVSINYRLGALGFLSVGDVGNAGLKDQVLALTWVQENIAAFGGDPHSVTIFGQSAGASSVHYLILSPLAQGLFHNAIAESGSALNVWAIELNPKERAIRLAALLGYNTTNSSDLLEFLRGVPVKTLIDLSPETLTLEDARNNIGLPFVPTIENLDESLDLNEELFLIEHPMDIIRKGTLNRVPFLMGYNSHEAMLFIRRLQADPTLLYVIENDFKRMIPNDLNIPGGRDSIEGAKVTKLIRDFYIGTRTVSVDTKEEMILLLTDIMFVRGIIDSARLHSHYSNSTYFYRFGFDGALGLYKRLMGIPRPGVCHGDELGYLFHFGFFNLNLDPTSPEIQIQNRMVKMWTNFAKYSNPTPLGRNDNVLGVNWQPINNKLAFGELPYLDINMHMDLKYNPDSNRLLFWDQLYDKYNEKILSTSIKLGVCKITKM